MYYPSSSIDSLMPDMLLKELGNQVSSLYNAITYFTDDDPQGGTMAGEMKKAPVDFQSKMTSLSPALNGSRGIVPTDIAIHPVIEYSFRHGSVALNGMDNGVN